MRHYIFTVDQKNALLNIFKDIEYSRFASRFEFVEITGNRWILPEAINQSEDVLKLITVDNEFIIDSIISNCELREILDEEKITCLLKA